MSDDPFMDETADMNPPKIQWHKETKEVGATGVMLFTGFGITVGQDGSLDTAMEESIAVSTRKGKGNWRLATMQFDSGNQEQQWIRAGMEVLPLTRGVQSLYDKTIMRENDALISDVHAPMVERQGIALGWSPRIDRAGNLVWDNDLTPEYRSFHRMPLMLRGLGKYAGVLQMITLSTMTDNIVLALEQQRDCVLAALKAKDERGKAMRIMIRGIHEELIIEAKIDPEGDEARGIRNRLPFWSAGLILGAGGVEDKGKVKTKKVNVFKAIIPDVITVDWLTRRVATLYERTCADSMITEMIAWSNKVSRDDQMMKPADRLEVQKRRAVAMRITAPEPVEVRSQAQR